MSALGISIDPCQYVVPSITKGEKIRLQTNGGQHFVLDLFIYFRYIMCELVHCIKLIRILHVYTLISSVRLLAFSTSISVTVIGEKNNMNVLF